ncbi:acyltransferase family protein [Candidatus Pelagibacter sp.]|jgi:peptidoglycan/LPS O-acetylase OafA/YrhL|nr:acyltransferase family protein [Candidatus Pelagibacter sp.]
MRDKKIFHPHIEGMRGLAVLFVVLYHLNNNFFFGYLGVDIFFVISGYVITKSLITSFDQNSSNVLSDFYSKRILRIYPVLLFIIVITLICYALLGNISNYEVVFKTFVYSAFGLSNIYFLRRSNSYFEDEIDNPLIHTWSLGVEEQFYLVFPVILFFFFKFQNKLIQNKFLIFFLIFIFILSIFSFFQEHDELIKFWSPLLRFWELLIGCILCFAEKKDKQKLFLIFIIAIITALNIFSFEIKNLYLSLSIIFSAYTISQNKSSLVNLCFSNKYFRFIGKISYSMYLIHYPLLYFLNIYFDITKLDVIIVYLICLIFLSKFTYQLIEKKFTSIRVNFFKDKIQKKILILISIIIIISSAGLISFVNNSLYIQKEKLDHVNILNKKFKEYQVNTATYKNYDFLNKNIKECIYQNFNKRKIISNCYLKKDNEELLFFVGDSHAASLIMLTEKKYADYDVILAANAGGLFSHFFYKIDGDIINEQSLMISKKYNYFFLESWRFFKDLSLNYDKSYFVISSDYLTHIYDNIILNKNFLHLNDKSDIFEQYAKEIINLSKNLENNQKIIFIKNIPQPVYSSFECLKHVIFLKNQKNFCNYERNFYGPDKVFSILKTNKTNNLELYDLGELFCDMNDCEFFNKKNGYNMIIDDKSHITQQAVELFEDDFFNFIKIN